MIIRTSDLYAAVKNVLEANKANTLPIKYENKKFENNNQPYAEFILSPDRNVPLGPKGAYLRGIIGINVYVLPDTGAPYAAEEGEKFVDLFPAGEFIPGVLIPVQGTVNQQINGSDDRSGWKLTSVTIPYDAVTC